MESNKLKSLSVTFFVITLYVCMEILFIFFDREVYIEQTNTKNIIG